MSNHKNKEQEEEESKENAFFPPSAPLKNKQEKNEVSTSQEKEFDVSTEDLNENELRESGENQPYRNAELENDRFNDQLGKK